MCKIFSLVPSKNLVTRENWDKLSVYFSIFLRLNLQLYQKNAIWHLAIWQIGVLVNFIIQKLKMNPLVCLSFFWWQVFWVNERKYFTHIPGHNNFWTKFGNSNHSELSELEMLLPQKLAPFSPTWSCYKTANLNFLDNVIFFQHIEFEKITI